MEQANPESMTENTPDDAQSTPRPVVRPRPDHPVSRKDIDDCALKVLYRLARAGHTAYLVGGGVRDLLLGRRPKDFDVATDARPGQIKRMFRNCWLIGRRFRLAHVKFGDTVIETSTFRRPPPKQEDEGDLLVRSDNTFGTPQEDAFRRDFTINGLFYDIGTFSVIDYVGGIQDLEDRLVRCIGDPDVRLREDPVRMLRAVRFASRLGFAIERQTRQAILRHAPELSKASPARLLEEIQRLFSYGAGEAAFRLLAELGLLREVFPCVAAYLGSASPEEAEAYFAYLHRVDEVTRERGEVDVPLAFAALLWPILAGEMRAQGAASPPADRVRALTSAAAERVAVPRRLRDTVGQILTAQGRLHDKKRRRYNKAKFVARPFFPAALLLYRFRVEVEALDPERLGRWQALAAEVKTEGAAEQAPAPAKRSRKRRPRRRGRRRKRSKPPEEGAPAADKEDAPKPAAEEKKAPAQEPSDQAEKKRAKPRKRSRRKRTSTRGEGETHKDTDTDKDKDKDKDKSKPGRGHARRSEKPGPAPLHRAPGKRYGSGPSEREPEPAPHWLEEM